MKKELEKRLLEAFPRLYSDPDSRFAEDGFAVGDGWFDIVRKLSEQLTATGAEVYAFQVKEKMGGLRFYFSPGWMMLPGGGPSVEVGKRSKPNERTNALVRAAEQESKRTCELCGGEGKRTTIGSRGNWIKTLCPDCETRLARERGKGPSGPWKEGRRLPHEIAKGSLRPDPRDLPPEGFVETSYATFPEGEPGARKVAIIGSRDFPYLDRVRRFVAELPEGTVIVTGGARGVDRAAEVAAHGRGLEVVVLKPDWKRQGKGAGLAGNERIVEATDEVAAFWDGKSKGTTHAIDLALAAGKPVRVFGKDGKALPGTPWRAKRGH